MKRLIPLICLMLALMLTLSSCAALPLLERLFGGIGGQTPYPTTGGNGEVNPAGSRDLMKGVTKRAVADRAPSDKFLSSQMDFCVELFKKSVSDESGEGKNPLVSPLSAMIALSMTANGASGETLAEMEQVLGGGITLEDLNSYLHSYMRNLYTGEKCKFTFADSIWLRNHDLTVKEDFLQTNADYYAAGAYAVPFNGDTLKQVNDWVSEHTDGMIDKMLDKFSPDTALLLINTLCFDAEWENKYDSTDVVDAIFYAENEEEQEIELMCSNEKLYLRDEGAAGFLRPYADGKYSFAALLPDPDVDVYDYVAGLTAERLLEVLHNAESTNVSVRIPKFRTEDDWALEKILPDLGMPTAFTGGADFSGISETNALHIGAVTHKTFIEVGEQGTRAGAATVVDVRDGIVLTMQYVWLDRPFVYMIVDNETSLPIFMGILARI